MQTLKLKYRTDEESLNLIKRYMRQYSSIIRFAYNRLNDGYSQSDIKEMFKSLNNIELMNSWFRQSSIYDAKTLLNKSKVIFGGKSNFIKRCKNKISKEDFSQKRLSPVYSIGEIVNRSVKSNRFFHIEPDLENITFKPNKTVRVNLELIGLNKRKNILKTLYLKQESHQVKITYKLDLDYVYISFDETDVANYKTEQIENRIFSIDLNPNYIGWSVIDWKSSSDFSLVKSGVISIKSLNDKELNLKNQHVSSEDPRRIYLHNKREHEVYEISKSLIDKALYYKCSIFSIEDLSIKSSDKGNGKKFNSLCNNLWLRDKLVNNLTKRCNIFNIKLLKVKPEYSSFIGNFLFRDLNLPDMILASIEISRRGYEFYNQYIIKTKEIKKNIIQPEINEFRDKFLKSLEEFKVQGEFTSLIDLYYFFKKSKLKYRLSLDLFNDLKFSSLKHSKSYIGICYL